MRIELLLLLVPLVVLVWEFLVPLVGGGDLQEVSEWTRDCKSRIWARSMAVFFALSSSISSAEKQQNTII